MWLELALELEMELELELESLDRGNKGFDRRLFVVLVLGPWLDLLWWSFLGLEGECVSDNWPAVRQGSQGPGRASSAFWPRARVHIVTDKMMKIKY
jgi:hypothetical protein